MERGKFLQSDKGKLETEFFSVVDAVNFCHNYESQGQEKKFAFEVMYEGMVRSWVPLEGKKPLGVIFKNHLITLHDSSRMMEWEHALGYCQEIKIEGYACSAGKFRFWKKLVNLSKRQKRMLDDLLVSLGGDTLAVQGKWYWSSSQHSFKFDDAWLFCTADGANQGGVVCYSKDGGCIARPVLNLSELS